MNKWRDNPKDNEIIRMAQTDPDLLNSVYKEISEQLGVDTAMDIYQLFKGQQVSFPMRFFHIQYVRKMITQEYDGTNISQLAAKYGYCEKTIRRILHEGDYE
jgi:Mor family transcriptional regulator